MKRVVLLLFVLGLAGACGSTPPPVKLVEEWPANPPSYADATDAWTRRSSLRGQYQEVLELAATFKSPEWRAARATRDADYRNLTGEQRQAFIEQARAEAAGPYEVELMITTWDRRENDLDRGKRSVWGVVLIDQNGTQVQPLEIVKDRRPPFTVRADFPALGDFATAYIARFPRTTPLLGPDVRKLRLRFFGVRGSVEVEWDAP
ncbi:MAG TPA: hypothetical protein VLB44_05095 [Kofleriaceae bacterium]|nr:hypothetical protein [Kofleriaceae bacterium]